MYKNTKEQRYCRETIASNVYNEIKNKKLFILILHSSKTLIYMKRKFDPLHDNGELETMI